jgi:quercetin dioxygenase-like cupin family protein
MGIEMDENIKSNSLADMVNYQEGSVVSRSLMKKEHGTVTLFAFDQGQGLSEHTTPFDAIIYSLDGTADVTISGKSMTLKKGEMVILPGNEPHALKAVQKFKMLLTMIR